MQERNSRIVTVEDKPVEKGNIAVIDFEGFVDEKAFEGGKAEGYELEIEVIHLFQDLKIK